MNSLKILEGNKFIIKENKKNYMYGKRMEQKLSNTGKNKVGFILNCLF